MDESVIATFDDVKFTEGVTKLTQQNWQDYFSPVIKNGVYKGLEPRNYLGNTTYSNGRTFITDGVVFVNGMSANIRTNNGYTDIGTCPSGKHDRLICIRVNFEENSAELIQKTDVMRLPGSGTVNYNGCSALTMAELCQDESYLMERSSYYEIPIFYQGASNLSYTSKGLDLRRVINKTRQMDPVDTVFKGATSNILKISGNNVYHLNNNQGNVEYIALFDPINLPDGAIICVSGSSSPSNTLSINFPSQMATNNNLICTDIISMNNDPHAKIRPYSSETITGEIEKIIKITYAGTKGTHVINDLVYCYSFDFYYEKI